MLWRSDWVSCGPLRIEGGWCVLLVATVEGQSQILLTIMIMIIIIIIMIIIMIIMIIMTNNEYYYIWLY
jgi:heme/copper-type cytochrome/quinol oxidase subunit 2